MPRRIVTNETIFPIAAVDEAFARQIPRFDIHRLLRGMGCFERVGNLAIWQTGFFRHQSKDLFRKRSHNMRPYPRLREIRLPVKAWLAGSGATAKARRRPP